jgi:hypothetical protein
VSKSTKIKTFEEACKLKGISPLALPEVSMLPAEHQKALIAVYKLYIITEALNEGWKPNWNDASEWKYFPYFLVKSNAKNPGGTGLSCNDYCFDLYSAVGSRLCFKSSDLAKYAGTKFAKLYAEAHLYL